MLGVEMYYSVKTLLERGRNISEISRELGIDRKTVRKIREKLEKGIYEPKYSRSSILDPYKEKIMEYLSEGLTGVLIHERLLKETELKVSYSCVKKYLKKLRKTREIYVPLITPPGEEAQVDFGYVGYLYDEKKDKKVKSWIFCMTLSYSRYKYYELVQHQDVQTFLRCHINAFEYFGGAPKVVKIDNLKSGVLKANFYEAVIQREYAEMLNYYGSSPLTCKVKYPQEKGKVESGIKYVKNNFFKSIKEENYHNVIDLLRGWQENVCNKKIHGTTRKIPYEQYVNVEKDKLTDLPAKRYEVCEISERVVNNYGHITFKYNFYSVPCEYVGSKVIIRSNGEILKIYNDKYEEISLHTISKSTGEFITKESHNPKLQVSDYEGKSREIGGNTLEFYNRLKEEKPYQYQRIMQGIFKLVKTYGDEIVELSCKRALKFNTISYLSVKRICELGLYAEEEVSVDSSVKCNGYAHILLKYDVMFNN
jgi:transposase